MSSTSWAHNIKTDLPFSLKHFNTSSGLPQNSIQGFVQDEKGNIWIATFGGLVKFDGTDFKVISSETDSSITSNRILYIDKTEDEVIVAVTSDHKLLIKEKEQFKTYDIQIGGSYPYGLSHDANQKPLILSRIGIVQFNNGKFLAHPDYPKLDAPFKLNFATYCPKKEIAYYGGDKGLLILSKDGVTEHPFYKGIVTSNAFLLGDTLFIHSINSTDIWIGDSLIKQIPNSHFKEDRSAFAVTNERVIWEAHNSGIRKINPDLSYEEYGDDYLLPTIRFRSIFIDVEQNIWIGSNDNGFLTIRPDLFNVYIDKDNTQALNLQGLCADSSGIWLGLHCSGLGHYSFENPTIRTIPIPHRGNYTNFHGGCISSIEKDENGIIWIGSYGDGLIKYENNNFVSYTIDNGLSSNTVISLLPIGNDTIVLGLENGIQFLNSKTGEIYSSYPKLNRIHQIMKDSKNRLWFGSYKGVYMKDGKDFVHFTTEDGLPHNNCRAFYEDEYGDIWIGTYGNGLARYKDGKFNHIGTAHGLYNGVVSTLVRDGDLLWMTSNKGIYAASFTEIRNVAEGDSNAISCISFGTEAGLNTEEFNGSFQKNGLKHPNGKLYFPSMNGLVELDPQKIPVIPTPEIFIDYLLVDGATEKLKPEFDFQSDVKRVGFKISVPTYAFPQNVSKEYRLVGYENSWKNIPSNQIVDFTNLAAGKYTLELRARNRLSNTNNFTYFTYTFTVLKPWYLNQRFIVLIVLGIILISGLTILFIRRRSIRTRLFLQKAIKASTEELRLNKGRLETLIQNTNQLIWSMDTEYNLVTYNEMFVDFMQKVFKFKPEEGLNMVSQTKSKTRDFWLPYFKQTLSGAPVTLEIKVEIEGKPKVLQTSLFPIIEKDGEVSGIVGFSLDRTEEVKREEELEKAKKEAEHAARVKSEFLATMSHEIRTPLNGVIGTTSLLQRENLTPEQIELVETIRLSSDTLMTIINEILDFSKLESGQAVLEEMAFNPVQTVEDTIALVKVKAQQKGISLSYNHEKSLPKLVSADPTKIKQVLLNILNNAVKFTEQGEVKVHVYLDQKYNLHFSVSDTGIGITQAQVKKLFIPFHQLDRSTSRKYGGTGLGLSISKKLVEVMGGEIHAEPNKTKGSTFSFFIPVKIVSNTASLEYSNVDLPTGLNTIAVKGKPSEARFALLKQTLTNKDVSLISYYDALNTNVSIDLILDFENDKSLADSTKLPIVHIPLNQEINVASVDNIINNITSCFLDYYGPKKTPDSISLLVAEDNLVNQKIITMLLNKLGYRSDVVANGLEVLDAISRQHYDIILMDVQMPEMDGLEATQKIRAEVAKEEQPIIIAVTANALEGDRENCIAAGMNDYLSKPVTFKTLEKCLTHWLLKI